VKAAIRSRTLLLACLFFISLIAGMLVSRPSLIGRIGIEFFYTEYKFLRTWWKAASVFFLFTIVLYSLLLLLRRKLSTGAMLIACVIAILLLSAGLFLTWKDFHETTTHRWLKWRFHTGFYLFWFAAFLVPVHFLINLKSRSLP